MQKTGYKETTSQKSNVPKYFYLYLSLIILLLLVFIGIAIHWINVPYYTPKPAEIQHYEDSRDKLTGITPNKTVEKNTTATTTTNCPNNATITLQYKKTLNLVKNILPVIGILGTFHILYEALTNAGMLTRKKKEKREFNAIQTVGQLVGLAISLYVFGQILTVVMTTIC